jgi:signal recognition particle receptor subunit beta
MIVFVIDSADVGRLASAHALLLEVLMFPSLLSKPVLLAYNKTDIADVGSVSLIDSVLRVHELLQGCPKVKRKVIGSCLDESLALDTLSFIEMELN